MYLAVRARGFPGLERSRSGASGYENFCHGAKKVYGGRSELNRTPQMQGWQSRVARIATPLYQEKSGYQNNAGAVNHSAVSASNSRHACFTWSMVTDRMQRGSSYA